MRDSNSQAEASDLKSDVFANFTNPPKNHHNSLTGLEPEFLNQLILKELFNVLYIHFFNLAEGWRVELQRRY